VISSHTLCVTVKLELCNDIILKNKIKNFKLNKARKEVPVISCKVRKVAYTGRYTSGYIILNSVYVIID